MCQQLIIHQPSFGQLFEQKQATFCELCWQKFVPINPSVRCQACKGSFFHGEAGPICQQCQYWQSEHGWIVQHHALFEYNEFAKSVIHQIKFLGDIALIDAFVTPANEYFRKNLKKAIITTVPSHTERLKLRKIDVMKHFCVQLDYAFEIFLVKLLHTPHQSEQSKKERLEMAYPFRALKPACEALVLVDDVYTTGATLHQAVYELQALQKQKKPISTFSLFR